MFRVELFGDHINRNDRSFEAKLCYTHHPSSRPVRPFILLFSFFHSNKSTLFTTFVMDSDSDMVADQRVCSPCLARTYPHTTQFFSFKMGSAAPPNTLNTLPRHSHRRSRSRNSSISSFPLSSSAPSLSLSAPDSPTSSVNPPPTKRPTSHHHRRSSVSTRRESAELMGVSLPELPTAHSDDNVNLGDRDSIRRRALWALEGKPDLAFSKVEIPDITSPDTSKPFDFRKCRFPNLFLFSHPHPAF